MSTDTSAAAAASIAEIAPTIEAAVLERIRESAGFGQTCDEIEIAMVLSHQCASARLRALSLSGKIADLGERRPTRSGRKAIVWYAVTP